MDEKGIALSSGEDTEIPLDYKSLTEPPTLNVSIINQVDCVAASCGNYQWSVMLPDGTSSELLACGLHSLDQQEHPILYTAFPAGILPPLEESGEIGSIAPVFKLDFGEILPEIVSTIRWLASHIGGTENHTDFEEVTVDIERAYNHSGTFGDDNYIYKVYPKCPRGPETALLGTFCSVGSFICASLLRCFHAALSRCGSECGSNAGGVLSSGIAPQ